MQMSEDFVIEQKFFLENQRITGEVYRPLHGIFVLLSLYNYLASCGHRK